MSNTLTTTNYMDCPSVPSVLLFELKGGMLSLISTNMLITAVGNLSTHPFNSRTMAWQSTTVHQSLITDDWYAIPLDFRNGLAYLNMCPFTDDELENLPHVIMTRDAVWSPSQYDSIPSSHKQPILS